MLMDENMIEKVIKQGQEQQLKGQKFIPSPIPIKIPSRLETTNNTRDEHESSTENTNCKAPDELLSWQIEMSNFYDKPENMMYYKLCTSRPMVGRFYAILYNAIGLRWHRCKLLDRDEAINTCTAFLVDIGYCVKALPTDLNELDPKFVDYYALGSGPDVEKPSLPCTMSYIKYVLNPQADYEKTLHNTLPAEIAKGVCFISHVNSPSCFYVHSKESVNQLIPMMHYIKTMVDEEPELSVSDVIPGMKVAVSLFDEFNEQCYYRAVVRIVMELAKAAKVVLVDYGNEVSVKIGSIRHLPKYFCKIPGLAQRVHIDVKNLIPDPEELRNNNDLPTICWSERAASIFRKYLNIFQELNPKYFVWRPRGSSVVPLDFFNQDLSYYINSSTWGIKPDAPEPKYMKWTDFSTAKISKNLARSIGIDIVYEVVTHPTEPYKFEKAWDQLLEQGVAVMLKEN